MLTNQNANQEVSFFFFSAKKGSSVPFANAKSQDTFHPLWWRVLLHWKGWSLWGFNHVVCLLFAKRLSYNVACVCGLSLTSSQKHTRRQALKDGDSDEDDEKEQVMQNGYIWKEEPWDFYAWPQRRGRNKVSSPFLSPIFIHFLSAKLSEVSRLSFFFS